jgi:hypothetical protein
MLHRINLDAKWEKLFRVECYNDYYNSGKTADFSFIPTNKTSIILKNYKLFLKEDQYGMTMFCNKSAFLRIINHKKGKVKKLTFLVKNKNNYLWNHTDLSFEENNKVNYLTNNLKSIDGAKLLLHKKKFLDGKGKVRLLNGFQTIKMTDVKVKSEVLNDKNEKIDKNIWLDERGDTKYIRLREFKEGKYTLMQGNNAQEFYVLDYIAEPIWGILDLYLTDIPKELSLLQKDEISYKEYSLSLTARSTYWKYYIVSQDKNIELKVDDAKISYNGEPIEFSKPKKVSLSNGALAFIIESKQPIGLKEPTTVTDKLELRLKKNNKWLNKTLRIPKPGIKVIKPDKETNKIYSTTYIYV